MGISVSNLANVTENFIELLINFELSPSINKVFLSSSLVVFDNFYTTDYFFTYLFNKFTNEIIMLRRSLLNIVPVETYILKIDNTFNSNPDIIIPGITSTNNLIIGVYDAASDLHLPLLKTGTNNYILLHNITFPHNSLNCSFSKAGLFSVNLHSFSEICSSGLAKGYIYYLCQNEYSILYNAQDLKDNSNTTVIIIAVLVSVAVVGLAVGVVGYYTKCFKDFSKFKVKLDVANREHLYTNKLDENLIQGHRSKQASVDRMFGTPYSRTDSLPMSEQELAFRVGGVNSRTITPVRVTKKDTAGIRQLELIQEIVDKDLEPKDKYKIEDNNNKTKDIQEENEINNQDQIEKINENVKLENENKKEPVNFAIPRTNFNIKKKRMNKNNVLEEAEIKTEKEQNSEKEKNNKSTNKSINKSKMKDSFYNKIESNEDYESKPSNDRILKDEDFIEDI